MHNADFLHMLHGLECFGSVVCVAEATDRPPVIDTFLVGFASKGCEHVRKRRRSARGDTCNASAAVSNEVALQSLLIFAL